jgi:hypothetical protein
MKTSSPSSRSDRASLGVLSLGALLFAAGSLLTGCANSTEVKIDSIAKPKAEESISYKIRNTNPAIAEDSLRNKEAVGFVRTALSGKGMYETTDAAHADLVLDVDYGVGPPQIRHETVSEPVYITLPGEVRVERVQVGTDRNGNPIYQTVTVQDPPHTEFAGYRDYVITTVVYEKYLKMTAHENKEATEGQPPLDVWSIDVTSEGQSHDLRKTLPVLAAASIDYVGKDSHGQKIIHLKDSDKDVAFVKKGM